jgi:outer membrane biosynthesis protein TonB
MPSLEIPPKSAPPVQPVKVRTGRYGELEEHELIHLLDALDDERSKARFRESIYISFIIYMAIVWFLFYGPRVLFHQPKLISPVDVLKERDKQLTFLDNPTNLPKLAPRPKATTEKAHSPQQAPDQKTLQRLQEMRKAEAPAPTPAPAPPATAQAPTPPAPQPPPPAPAPTQQALIEAPKPAPTRPNFSNPNQTPGDVVRQAGQMAARNRDSGDYGARGGPGGTQIGMGGVQILSDTQGVDFGPYIRKILNEIRAAWYPLIPEEARPPLNKQGETLIRFTIMPDGHIKATADGMILEGPSGDSAIDRACWGGITGVGQFPPLPANFKGPNLELRIDFLTNKPLPY